MKIVFLNIWNGKVGKDFTDFLKVQAQDTDVFCFQEAEEASEAVCKDILGDYSFVKGYKFLTDDEYFCQLSGIKKDFKLQSFEPVLSSTPDTGLALQTLISTDAKRINICNVHGVSKPGNKLDNEVRLTQSAGLIDYYKNISGPKIIGGDFNLEAETESVKLFEKNGYRNLIKEFIIPTTRNRLIWERFPESKQYFSDFIFVSPDITITSFLVLNNEVSDHLPLILNIDF